MSVSTEYTLLIHQSKVRPIETFNNSMAISSNPPAFGSLAAPMEEKLSELQKRFDFSEAELVCLEANLENRRAAVGRRSGAVPGRSEGSKNGSVRRTSKSQLAEGLVSFVLAEGMSLGVRPKAYSQKK